MFRRRIVRAVYAVIIAVSAAAWSGWFVDQGAAVGEEGGSEQAWLAPPVGSAASSDSANRPKETGSAGRNPLVYDSTTTKQETRPTAGTNPAETAAGLADTIRLTLAETGAPNVDQPGGMVTVVRGKAGKVLTEEGGTPPLLGNTGESSDANAQSNTSEAAVKDDNRYAKPAGKTVYLTFDDGPSKLTPQVLDILKKENIKATFFVLGEQVKAHPELLKRIVAEGHTVGNHSYNHEYKELYGGFGEFADQIVRTEEELQAAADIRTRLVRAPGGTFGNFDQSYFDAMNQAGYTMFDWNVDSGDSVRVGVPASEIKSNVRSSKLYPETIVLLHDSASHAESVKALPDIISYYKSLGYAFAPLMESVKPVTFRVSDKLKWSRPKATASEQRAVRQGLAEGALPFVLSGVPAESKVNNESVMSTELELIVNGSNRTVIFEPGAYAADGDDWLVPLRELVEGLGGAVSWSGEERQAVAVMQDGARVVVAEESGDSVNRQGKVFVLLRNVLARMNGKAVEPVREGNRIVLGAVVDGGKA
ncbi:polysaccharide deacetylase family protein [Paenibacillus kobensis]|uniref:polysaccharide deacetylase family protein n=1 Tax=Paenibacillus kobensis TaxID=59841 RepID=UPI0013E2CCDB|nr:polysaccharide deacetylase family protein [Paenibacillus kobensis]